MVDYDKALKIGFSNARKMEENKELIDAVFYDLNAQLKKATNDKLFIHRRDFISKNIIWKGPEINFGTNAKSCIAAYNPNAKERIVYGIAIWNQNDGIDFDCVISFGNKKMHCGDAGGLEDTLKEMLQDPVIGGLLHTLVNLP